MKMPPCMGDDRWLTLADKSRMARNRKRRVLQRRIGLACEGKYKEKQRLLKLQRWL